MSKSQHGTVADTLAATLHSYGVRRIFGVPGGGSSLELIDACAARDIAFVLTHTETAAAIMAAVTGELSNAPGVVSTGLGPGTASAVNGVAYGYLDRAPMLVLTDGYHRPDADFVSHQRFDQAALMRPVTKAQTCMTVQSSADRLAQMLDTALAAPSGPVHVEMSAAVASAAADGGAVARPAPTDGQPGGEIAHARRLLAGARRPAMVVGLQARNSACAGAIAAFTRALACPVMTTYKAKGVFADGDPLHAGLFTGGQREAPWLADADLLLLCGVDPVELIASPWPYDMKVLNITEVAEQPHYCTPTATVIGPLAESLATLQNAGHAANWDDRPGPMALPDSDGAAVGLAPQAIVRLAAACAPRETRLAVDAGAHMLAPMAMWPARAPNDVLISNGLSTMGFALPAAIAAALETPARPTLAITGDGGLTMCVGELATAAREKARIVVVVFNDAALSLIDLKQQQRGFPTRGVRYPRSDFAQIAKGFGCRARRVDNESALEAALTQAFAEDGPALIDATVDPTGYRRQVEALRGVPAAGVGRS